MYLKTLFWKGEGSKISFVHMESQACKTCIISQDTSLYSEDARQVEGIRQPAHTGFNTDLNMQVNL